MRSLITLGISDEGHEAMRDLVRARHNAAEDLRRVRQRIQSFLLRHGRHYQGSPWKKMHAVYGGMTGDQIVSAVFDQESDESFGEGGSDRLQRREDAEHVAHRAKTDDKDACVVGGEFQRRSASSSTLKGTSCWNRQFFMGMMKVETSADCPEMHAWLTMSVKTAQAE